jgi:transcription initiation factor TFIID TATA-box-binding protein
VVKVIPPKIQNVISTADLHQHIDARKLKQYQWGKYDTEVYGGRCGYIKNEGMQGRVSVFLSGKMISTGAKSVSQSIWQLEHAMHLLCKNKLAKQVNLEYKVQNIVATFDLHKRLDVKRVIGSLSNYIYEPDNFPGVIYKPSGNGVSCLIFASGKVVIAGAKSEKQLNKIAQEIAKIVTRSNNTAAI